MFVIVLLASGLSAAALTWATKELALKYQLLDSPNARSSHHVPTPRLGGVAIALTFMTGWIVGLFLLREASFGQAWVVVAALAAGTVGLMDDLRAVGPVHKLLGQTFAVGLSLIVATRAPEFLLDGVWIAVAAIWVVGFSNAFNFMDGSDGLAAGCAAVFAASLGALCLGHSPAGAVMDPWIVAVVSLGFLIMNFSPASIFMGDSGSLFLGALLGALSVQTAIAGASPVAAVLVLGPFAFDVVWTLLRRLRRGEPIWKAHRSHLYQRLLIAGRSHRFVAYLYYSWSIACGLLALAYDNAGGTARGALLLIAATTAVGVVLMVGREERRARS
jgi:UDP-N-acetylmuramyl pentapeptide phosphotransferase/UDP-N-acetylglucosamine-1-phosphate transferase